LIHKKYQLIRANDIFSVRTSIPEKSFEKIYISSRQKENRIYSDEQVAQLPFIEPSHIHFDEWQVRMRSSARLTRYLEKKMKSRMILEVGCGNGWLSAKLANLDDSTVTGIDINKTEISQARRVFREKPNASFAAADLMNVQFDVKFDIIVFAASIQYFSSFDNIIREALSLLEEDGEIHILDSHFYQAKDLERAREGSQRYYQSIGFDIMAEFYFHHSFDSLKNYKHSLLFNPRKLKNRLFAKQDPFPWIRITAS
jgi:ubiquinone/menaquinone biosynthesis C-methylase UbiE